MLLNCSYFSLCSSPQFPLSSPSPFGSPIPAQLSFYNCPSNFSFLMRIYLFPLAHYLQLHCVGLWITALLSVTSQIISTQKRTHTLFVVWCLGYLTQIVFFFQFHIYPENFMMQFLMREIMCVYLGGWQSGEGQRGTGRKP